MEEIFDSAGKKNDRVGDQEHQGAGAKQEQKIPPAKRWIFLSVRWQIVIEKNQSQIMWKIFGCQHQSKACASGDVPFPVRLRVLSSIDCARFLRPNVEVVPKPGKEHEEGVLFGKTIIDNCNCSGGPKQGAQ